MQGKGTPNLKSREAARQTLETAQPQVDWISNISSLADSQEENTVPGDVKIKFLLRRWPQQNPEF